MEKVRKMFRNEGRKERRDEWTVEELAELRARRRITPGKLSRTMFMTSSPYTTLRTPRKEPARAPIQGKGLDALPTDTVDVKAKGSGVMLPEEVRAKMEAALGMDFSEVRIHVGPQAASVGALAFTRGLDIFFAPGHYQPWSREGQELLAHELTHVVQQSEGRAGASREVDGVPINDEAGLEREADLMGAQVARDEQVRDGNINPNPPNIPTTESRHESEGVPQGPQGDALTRPSKTLSPKSPVRGNMDFVIMRSPSKSPKTNEKIDWNKVKQCTEKIASILAKGRQMSRKDIYELIFSTADLLHEFAKVTEEWIEANPAKVALINRFSIDGIRAIVATVTTTDPAQATWVDLSLMYLFELGSAKLVVDDINAPTLKELKEHEGVEAVRQLALKKAQSLSVGETMHISNKPWHYRFNDMVKNLKGEAGLLTEFLGTYNPKVTAIKVDKNRISLAFNVYNKSSLASLTRFRRAVGNQGNRGILKSKKRGAGIHLGGDFEQFFRWAEEHEVP